MIGELRPYAEYKESGLPWLGEIPRHWQVQRLKNWVAINRRTLGEDTPREYVFDYIDIAAVTTGRLAKRASRMRYGDSPSRARRLLREGDTIVSTVRTYLKAVYTIGEVTHPLVASTGFAVLTPRADTSPKCLGYVAQSEAFTRQVTAESVGIAYPAISETRLGNIAVTLPPPDEQAAIVRFLDWANGRLERAIRAKRKVIGLLNEQKQAIIHRAVTCGLDPDVPLKPSGIPWLGDIPQHWEIISLRMRYSVELGKMLDAKRITGRHSVPYLRNRDVQWDRVLTDDLPVMDIPPSEVARYTVKQGDLLVCEGGQVGRAAFWDARLPVCGFQKALHRVRCLDKSRDYPRFSFYQMQLAAGRGVFTADGNENTIAHLTCEKLRRHRFIFPPFAEQVAIAEMLNTELRQFQVTISRLEREIALLREYRTRLVADVVTGKLDVRAAAARLPDAAPPDSLDSEPDPGDEPELADEETAA